MTRNVVLAAFTPGANIVSRYWRELYAPQRLVRTHIWRFDPAASPDKSLADKIRDFRTDPPDACRVRACST